MNKQNAGCSHFFGPLGIDRGISNRVLLVYRILIYSKSLVHVLLCSILTEVLMSNFSHVHYFFFFFRRLPEVLLSLEVEEMLLLQANFLSSVLTRRVNFLSHISVIL